MKSFKSLCTFTSLGRLFQVEDPEYLILCLKHSFLGWGDTKHPDAVDRNITEVLTSFLKVKFSKMYRGVRSLYNLNMNFVFLRSNRSYKDNFLRNSELHGNLLHYNQE